MHTEIVLIGPVRTGKSTLGKILADKLGLKQVSFDEGWWKYCEEIGYDETLAREIRKQGGFLALVYYRNQFAAYPIERMLADYQNCVFDFGAAIYESDEMFSRVQRALEPYPNVILVLPSPDMQESLRILFERDESPPADLSFNILAHFLRHHTYYDLAKFTIYTKGKTPEESAMEILRLTGLEA